MDVCRVCGAEGRFPHHVVPEMMFGTRELFDYFECEACGCLQIASIPSDLSRHYPASYYSNAVEPPVRIWLKGQRVRHGLGEPSLLGAWMSRRYGPDACCRALAIGEVARGDAVLDVGGGSGAHLRPLRAAGFHNLLGVDAFVQREVSERGLRIRRGELRDLQARFRLIMMHHAFEHMPEPGRVLEDVSSRLEDRGVVLVRIPVLGHGWRTYGVNWVELDAPRHLYLHTRRSFEGLARRHGLEVVEVSYDSTEMEFWGSEQYAAGIPHRSPQSYEVDPRASRFSPEQIAQYRQTIRELNDRGESGRAAFVLRKAQGAGA